MLKRAGWFALQCLLTFICAYTLQNVAARSGYAIDSNALTVGMVMAVILIKVWTYKE